MKERLKEIFDYRDMVNSLVRRDLRGKYKGSVLGFLWTFINPRESAASKKIGRAHV